MLLWLIMGGAWKYRPPINSKSVVNQLLPKTVANEKSWVSASNWGWFVIIFTIERMLCGDSLSLCLINCCIWNWVMTKSASSSLSHYLQAFSLWLILWWHSLRVGIGLGEISSFSPGVLFSSSGWFVYSMSLDQRFQRKTSKVQIIAHFGGRLLFVWIKVCLKPKG